MRQNPQKRSIGLKVPTTVKDLVEGRCPTLATLASSPRRRVRGIVPVHQVGGGHLTMSSTQAAVTCRRAVGTNAGAVATAAAPPIPSLQVEGRWASDQLI